MKKTGKMTGGIKKCIEKEKKGVATRQLAMINS